MECSSSAWASKFKQSSDESFKQEKSDKDELVTAVGLLLTAGMIWSSKEEFALEFSDGGSNRTRKETGWSLKTDGSKLK